MKNPFAKKIIAEIKRIEIKTGDILVIETPGILSRKSMNEIGMEIRGSIGLKVLVLTEGMTIKCVLSKDDAEEIKKALTKKTI